MYHPLTELFQNSRVLPCVFCGWFAAQALKVLITFLLEKKLDWHLFFSAGGMPSSHTSMVISLAIMVGAVEGWNTPLFAACVTMACVVMYDATGVRRETGKQGEAINKILRSVIVDGEQITDDNLKEIVGHKPIEVLGGFIVGVIVAVLFLIF